MTRGTAKLRQVSPTAPICLDPYLRDGGDGTVHQPHLPSRPAVLPQPDEYSSRVSTLAIGNRRIAYEVTGDGPAVLCLAPGGLSASRIESWSRSPWNPLEQLSADYRVVAMDQRNTGTSWAPIAAGDDWGSYTDDQLALMDHLGIDTFAVVGMCIGGAFIARLLQQAPRRVTAAVAMQPIGLDSNRHVFFQLFDTWRNAVEAEHPEANEEAWESFRQALFGSDRLVWSVDDEALLQIQQPLFVLEGNDEYHPRSVSRRLVDLLPNASLFERWKQPEDFSGTDRVIREFLSNHAH